jgi:CubicO group peptidase (beta-lactamase class C family)
MAAGLAIAMLAAALWLPAPLAADDDLDAYILARMESARVPGLSVCVVRQDEVLLSRGYGLANVKKKVPVTPDTLFLLASISKPVAATALMQLCEQGRFGLDDPIGPHLPFAVVNPNHSGVPITFRQLLAHTSSVQDSGNMWSYLGTGDSPVTLGAYLKKYLKADKHYFTYGPGEMYNYSNIGYALCGYLVESLSGQPFGAYCEERLFAPLQMPETSWFLKDLDRSRVAMPHKPSRNGYAPYGHWGCPFYPCCQLRTSAPRSPVSLWRT